MEVSFQRNFTDHDFEFSRFSYRTSVSQVYAEIAKSVGFFRSYSIQAQSPKEDVYSQKGLK
ncbi:hypothetical protein DVH24_018052 [Malus domestica]|uniref:Uncharacterized protein n=1 Tax=Malus domestica TaxID=3750 RepID=A0A498KCE3_MALDO|nr:hypothetical protein DVH24_018052 [Malus domestica]